eukprot:6295141-Amphidinium_carterae.1
MAASFREYYSTTVQSYPFLDNFDYEFTRMINQLYVFLGGFELGALLGESGEGGTQQGAGVKRHLRKHHYATAEVTAVNSSHHSCTKHPVP